ncbi:S41 family peptidase [Bacteroides uniformis]|nr:S41 family peptidase [Bacteroides uniformis]
MKHVNYLSFFLLTLFSISFISCSDDDDNKLNTGITNQSWTEGKSLEISQDNELSVSFNAAAKWVASVTSGADWCKLNTTSGTKGQSTLKLSVSTSSTTDRTARISINIDGYSPASFEVTQKGISVPQTTEDMEINAKVDEYLREMYLWNDEYKTLNLDHNKGYEDFFYDALGSMTTNTLDKKATADGKYTLFSYIQKKKSHRFNPFHSMGKKEQTYSFGITGADVRAIGSEDNYTIYFFVQGVYPNSPAARAGIKRGSSIMQINGEKLTMNNYWQHYLDLLIPASAFSLKITEEDMEGGTQEKDISSEAMYCNPVLFSKVTTEEETPGHRIGYLVYSGFEAGYDQELFDVFKEFKSQNITDLILDLRYNGGGHVISANLIATCIAGAKSEGKDKERMEKRNNKREEELFAYSNYENLATSLSAGALNLQHVYCIVGSGTASASELVINSLKGIDVEVTLIGKRTTGKNVGMEPVEYTIRNNVYEVVPITFQIYNAKGVGDYENGFTPDIEIDENDPYGRGDGYYIYRDYGSDKEFLYARAIQEITGQAPVPTTRSAETLMRGKALKVPAIYRRGHEGMIKLPK